MKKNVLTLAISVLSLLTLFMTISLAEERKGAISVTPNVGGYFFEGDQNLQDGVTPGINLGYSITKNLALEGSFNFIDSELDGRNDVEVNGYLYKLDALYNITKFGKLVPYFAAGVGGITIDPDNGSDDTDFLVNYGAGLKYFFTDNVALRGDVRHILPFNESQNNLLCTVGLSFLFGGEKETPKVVEEPKAEEPKAEEPKVEEPKAEEPPKTDSDGDGVYDDLDKCPDTPKGVKVDTNGCPLDTDGDGVYDYLDECPGTPKGAIVDCRGCWVLEGVYFDTGKWNIKPQYFQNLDKVVPIIKNNPGIKLEIQGHTDNRGTEKYNRKLSENRANAVLEYLAGKGIDRSNLTSKGFGYSVPAAPNTTKEGMAKNRRIELKPIF